MNYGVQTEPCLVYLVLPSRIPLSFRIWASRRRKQPVSHQGWGPGSFERSQILPPVSFDQRASFRLSSHDAREWRKIAVICVHSDLMLAASRCVHQFWREATTTKAKREVDSSCQAVHEGRMIERGDTFQIFLEFSHSTTEPIYTEQRPTPECASDVG